MTFPISASSAACSRRSRSIAIIVGRPNNAAAYLPGLTVRTINTARGVQPRLDWSKGAIKLAAVKKAADEMRVATKALKILVCHHPLIETKDAVVAGGVYRGAIAAGILAEAGVDLILTGHVHNPFAVAIVRCGAGRLCRWSRDPIAQDKRNETRLFDDRGGCGYDKSQLSRLDGERIRNGDAMDVTAPRLAASRRSHNI